MTAAAKDTFGTILRLAAAPGSPVAIAELTSITPPTLSRGAQDATTLDGASEAMEFIAEGVYDPGEISCSGHLIMGSAADDLFIAALTTGNLYNFEIEGKAASGREEMSGSGLVTSYAPGEFTPTGKQTFTATIKVTGPIVQAPVV